MLILKHNSCEGIIVECSLCISEDMNKLIEYAERDFNKNFEIGTDDDNLAIYDGINKTWILDREHTNNDYYEISTIEII